MLFPGRCYSPDNRMSQCTDTFSNPAGLVIYVDLPLTCSGMYAWHLHHYFYYPSLSLPTSVFYSSSFLIALRLSSLLLSFIPPRSLLPPLFPPSLPPSYPFLSLPLSTHLTSISSLSLSLFVTPSIFILSPPFCLLPHVLFHPFSLLLPLYFLLQALSIAPARSRTPAANVLEGTNNIGDIIIVTL